MRLKKLLFVHVPKTGGIALHSQLQQVFDPLKSIRFGDRESNRRFPHMPKAELRRFSYITGHQPLKTFRDKGIDYPAIIIFRDPVRRMVSLFNYLNESQHADHRHRRFKTFGDFIEWSQRSHSHFHLQCRFVAGTRRGIQFADEVMDATRAIGFLEHDHVFPALLERHYDDLLATLSGLLGVTLHNVKKNVSRSRGTRLEEEHLKRLEPLVGEDAKLYEEIGSGYEHYKARFLDALS